LSLIERISAPLARCSSTKVDVSLIDVFENAVVMAVRQRRARGASATATDPDEAAAGEGAGSALYGPFCVSHLVTARSCDAEQWVLILSERIASFFFLVRTSLWPNEK